MSDVFDEIISRLKQKAEAYEDIAWKFPLVFEGWKRKEKWVRLKDVLSAIWQIKQNYVLVPKEQICKPIEHIEQYFKRQDEFLNRKVKAVEDKD